MPKTAKKSDMRSYRRVLAVRFSALGDVAMGLPVIYEACRANPDVEFLFLTRPLPARLFINKPENLRVLAVNTSEYSGLSGLRKLFKEIRRGFPFDVMLDLHDVLRTRVLRALCRLSGIPSFHIDKDRRGRKRLTSHKRKMLAPLTPTVCRYRNVFSKAGFETPETFTSIFAETGASPEGYAHLSSTKKEGDTWIGIAPFAAHKGKIYPPERMREVVSALSARPGHKIFLFGGGPDETRILSEWEAPNVYNVAAARLGLENELALISALDVMLSMDSANMHLAGLCGVRTISIWGATHPYAGFAGRSQSPADIIQTDLPCRPCSIFGNKPCRLGDYPCLNSISPETILSHLP